MKFAQPFLNKSIAHLVILFILQQVFLKLWQQNNNNKNFGEYSKLHSDWDNMSQNSNNFILGIWIFFSKHCFIPFEAYKTSHFHKSVK